MRRLTVSEVRPAVPNVRGGGSRNLTGNIRIEGHVGRNTVASHVGGRVWLVQRDLTSKLEC